MIDSHCHLTHARFGALGPDGARADEIGVIDRARQAGLTGCLTIGTGVDDARAALALARRHAGFVRVSAGLDPFSSHRAGARFDAALDELETLLRGGDFAALGEIGLDYHYDLDEAAVQIERFERQLELARELDLPVVIHVREAHDDMRRVLRDHPENRGVIHSFTAGPAEAEAYLELGWYLAFNGVLTFKGAHHLREAAATVPPRRLLVETDSPYLAPTPHRGRRCEPAYVALTVAGLAEVRSEPPESVAARTAANAGELFGFA